MAYVRGALKLMVMFQNGQALEDVKYMNVQESIMCNFVVYVMSFPVSS